MKKINIAIDGPAGSGKSTTAKLVAEKLGMLYLDTGAMYRAVTLMARRSQIEMSDGPKIAEHMDRSEIVLRNENGSLRVFLDGEDVTEQIRLPEISAQVSLVSSHREVRERLVRQQKKISGNGGIVMDGRDIGTVVLPHADLKIFLVADPAVRAARRLADFQRNGILSTAARVEEEIIKRDSFDSSRKESPLRKADDAIEVDTTTLTIDEQVQRIVELAKRIVAKG